MGKVERGILVLRYQVSIILLRSYPWGLQLCWYSYICFVVSLVADDPILCTFQSLFSVFCCYKAAMPSLIHASLHTWESPCGMLGCSHLVP